MIENQQTKLCYETCDTDGCYAGNKGETASLYMERNNAIVTAFCYDASGSSFCRNGILIWIIPNL